MWGVARRGGQIRIERGGSALLYNSVAGAQPAENAWFAAGMVQAGLEFNFLARSRRIRVSAILWRLNRCQTLTIGRSIFLERLLTMRHEWSRKRYTMALAGTAGLALTAGHRYRLTSIEPMDVLPTSRWVRLAGAKSAHCQRLQPALFCHTRRSARILSTTGTFGPPPAQAS